MIEKWAITKNILKNYDILEGEISGDICTDLSSPGKKKIDN